MRASRRRVERFAPAVGYRRQAGRGSIDRNPYQPYRGAVQSTILPPVPESGARLPIGEAARRLSLHPRTLMAWERMGLVRPARDGGRRVYSEDELRWLGCLREFNRAGGISLQGVSALLRVVPCWAIRAQLGPDACAAPADTAPSAWRAASALGRLERAYTGPAPPACRDCGIWKARGASGADAWRARRNGRPVADATREDA